MLNELEDWRTLSLAVAAAGQTLFIAMYCALPWWGHYLGRALFAKSLVLAVLLDLGLLARFFGGWGGWDDVFVVLYCIMAAVVWLQVAAFRRVRRELSERTEHRSDA